MHSTTLLQWSIKIYQLEKPNNLTDFSGGCKSKVNQTFDWLTSKQPQASHLVVTAVTSFIHATSVIFVTITTPANLTTQHINSNLNVISNILETMLKAANNSVHCSCSTESKELVE